MTLNNDGCPFPYRCADCNYATKYCHSLKLHLRKYAHKPAMVLNNDGTPNPLPIIDVYGTRRGPKKKTDADGNPINMPIPAGSLSPETPTMVGGLGPLRLPGSSISPTSPGSMGIPGGLTAPGATRFPLLPPFVMAQMQMQMQQSLNQSGSPTRLGQVTYFFISFIYEPKSNNLFQNCNYNFSPDPATNSLQIKLVLICGNSYFHFRNWLLHPVSKILPVLQLFDDNHPCTMNVQILV
jgi:hypothetical protein